MRWRKRRPEGMSIGEFLFDSSADATHETATEDMLRRIFEEHCSDAKGMLSVSNFANMIADRAVGTGLAGNLHAIFTLRTAIAEGSDDRIDTASFSKGIRRVIERNPNGPAAKWILMEYRAILREDDGDDAPSSSNAAESSASSDALDGRDGGASEPVGAEKEWFYEDVDDPLMLHGPFSLQELQSWADDGHFDATMRVCTGPGSEQVLLIEALAQAGMESEAAVAQPSGWFYTDVEDESVLHGPFDLVNLQEWIDGGHFEVDAIVRNGRDGESIPLSTVLRIAKDGKAYTQAEFIEHYGGMVEWQGAAGDDGDSDSSRESTGPGSSSSETSEDG